MARSRNIKPGFFRNEILAELEPLTRILFAGLWTIADRAGRLEDRPKRIKADVLPYDECNIDAMLDELAESGFLARYKYGTARYIQILHFTDHQNPHKNEAESTIPPIPADGEMPSGVKVGMTGSATETPDTSRVREKSGTSTVQVPKQHGTNRADSLNTDSLNTDSLSPAPTRGERFDAFWSAYPKKRSKGSAERAWEKINPTAELTERIIKSVEAHKKTADWQKDDGQYIPYPATWLNAKGWEDEVSPASVRMVSPYAGTGYDPLRSLPPEELAAYEKQLAQAKRDAEKWERERRGA